MGQNRGKRNVDSPECDPMLASLGHVDKLEEFLNDNNSPVLNSLTRAVNEKWRTPLHCAILPDSSYNLKVIQLLLQRDKEDPSSEGKPLLANIQDAFKKTALHYAAASLKPRVVSLLLQFGADPNLKDDDGSTPLHILAKSNSDSALECAKLILDSGSLRPDAGSETNAEGKLPLVNLQDACEKTALHYAAELEDPQVVSLLLEYGADPSLKDANGDTPLHILAKSNSDSALECARRILDYPYPSTFVPDSKNVMGWTPLHVAAHWSAPKLIRLFIDRGFDFANVDKYGCTPLMTVTETSNGSRSEDNLECAKILLNAYTPEQVNTKNKQGCTALVLAKSTKMMKLLLDASPKTDLFAKDSLGDTVFHKAILRRCLPSVKALCEREEMRDRNKIVEIFFNSHKRQKNNSDKCLIHLALLYRQTKIVEYLLALHPDPDQWMGNQELMSSIYSKIPTAIAWKMNQSLQYDSDKEDEKINVNFRIIAVVKDPVKEQVQETKYLHQITKAPKEEQKVILLNPLVQIFLRRKWERTRLFSWIYFILQVSWIVGYTLMVYEMWVPNCHNTDRGGNQTESAEKKGGGGQVEGKRYMRILTSLGSGLLFQWKEDCRFNLMAIRCGAVVLYVLSVLVLFKEILQIILKGKAYFSDWINYIQLGIVLVALFNSAPAWLHSSASDVAPWQTGITAFGIFGAWVMLLSEFDNFSTCAVYSAILKKVLRTCSKMMLFYSPILIAFAMCFRLLTPGKGQHNYLLFSLIKVVVMMTGELDFEDAFYGDTTSAPSTSFTAILGQIMFLLLVVVMTIALLNLLTGLAVADVRKLLDDAEVERLSVQLERMYMIDSFILLVRKRLTCLDSRKTLLYGWNATSERFERNKSRDCVDGIVDGRTVTKYTTKYSAFAKIIMKDCSMELQASIRNVMVGEDEE